MAPSLTVQLIFSFPLCGIVNLSVFISSGVAPFALFLFSRFVWDCKGRNSFHSAKIYLKFFSGLTLHLILSPLFPSNSTPNPQITIHNSFVAGCKGNKINHTLQHLITFISTKSLTACKRIRKMLEWKQEVGGLR